MTETCKNICISKLNEYIRHIKYMIQDLEKEDGEVSISWWNKYGERFDNTWPSDEDVETKELLKNTVIKTLNNRIDEINKELENL